MNILPLILVLLLMLSALTVEKLEKHKNQLATQNQYQNFVQNLERVKFNNRQRSLFKDTIRKDINQLSFRFLYDKDARKKNSSAAQQYRMLNIDLMRIVYSNAPFYKNLEEKRPGFVEELVECIEHASESIPSGNFKRIEDIALLRLPDAELQEAFYHMLKGTISRKQLKEIQHSKKKFQMEKAYVSLFEFINDDGSQNNASAPQIEIQHAPYEILKTIFEKDEIVEQVIEKRKEYAKNGSREAFENEFKEKIRPKLDSKILNFKITPNADLDEYD